MTNEEICTQFMREHYTDEKLAALLAHAEDGKLGFVSCCCLVGALTADHPLQTADPGSLCPTNGNHLTKAQAEYPLVERAFRDLGYPMQGGDSEITRRAKIIPLIQAEIARRDALKAPSIREMLCETDAKAVARMSKELNRAR